MTEVVQEYSGSCVLQRARLIHLPSSISSSLPAAKNQELEAVLEVTP